MMEVGMEESMSKTKVSDLIDLKEHLPPHSGGPAMLPNTEGGAISQVRKLTAELAEVTAKLKAADETISAFATTIRVLARVMHP